MAGLFNSPDTTNYYSKDDIQKNKILALLSYLGILVLVPLFAAPDSKYARFHANQGLNLLIVSVLWGLANFLVSLILGSIGVQALSVIWGIVGWLVSIVFLLFMVIGILAAVQGRAKELPFIGGFRILK